MTLTRIRITGDGIKGGNTSVPVGTELSLLTVPASWEGQYEVISEQSEDEARKADMRASAVRIASEGLSGDDYTADGRPKMAQLNAAMAAGSDPVTVAERDAIWPAK